MPRRSEEHTSELQSRRDLVCRLLLEKKNDYHPRGVGLYVNCELTKPYWKRNGTAYWTRFNAYLLTYHHSQHSALVLAIFFFNDTATTEIYTLSLHDALPI